MKLKLYHLILPVAALAVLPSCHLYKEYEMPVENSAIMGDYKNALQDTDSTTLAHLSWQEVFTDPQLQQLIQTALDANRDLANAKLNIDIAQAQLKGAKLAYFPSVAFSPNGGAASYGGSDMSWSYTLPLAANWEVDVFGKLLNNKRKAQVNLEQSMDYEQAVRSQIICSVANTYYAIAWLQQQLDLTERTCEIWKEQVTTMEDLKAAARVNEAAVVQSRANYYNIASSIPDIKSSIAQLQNTMSILLRLAHSREYLSIILRCVPMSVQPNVRWQRLITPPTLRVPTSTPRSTSRRREDSPTRSAPWFPTPENGSYSLALRWWRPSSLAART